MKLLPLLLCLLLLTGCTGLVTNIDVAEEVIEAKLDLAEETLETTLEAAVRPDPIRLSEEEAAAVALEHAGVAAEQAEHIRISYETDDGIPEYEVEFFAGKTEYDYTIHAETGEILSFEIGD